MKHGNYTIKEFFSFHSLDQVIIPEIQRDYVWDTENVKLLLRSILDDFQDEKSKGCSNNQKIISEIPAMYAVQWGLFMRSQKNITNIGFLYAYFDPETYTKYILIDGQQRLTTIFVVLLYLYIRENRSFVFRRNYFPNRIPKIDYKVRQLSHDFFINFIDFMLDGNRLDTVTSQYWFHSSYHDDQTITSLLRNYRAIHTVLEKQDLTADYIENQVEFWYFDTAQSEQGEDLYLYMNSRGERVQANENVKAKLLEKLPESEKLHWGNIWEEWQNFFWLNKGTSANADRGFDEFLKWILVINKARSCQYDESVDMSEKIRFIIESGKIAMDDLQLAVISSYFNAIKRLLDAGLGRYFNLSFFSQKPSQLLYVRIFPLLMYAERYPEAKSIDLLRIARFFFNITRFDIISKSPLRFAGQCIHLMRELIDNDLSDVTEMMRFKEGERFEYIISDEEFQKLFLYNTQTDDNDRRELETLTWDAEDFEMCDGKVILLWNCMGFYPFKKDHDEFDKEKFYTVFDAFKQLFSERTDLLRRALLSKGDYTLHDGTSTNLNAYRYSLCQTRQEWLEVFENQNSQYMVIKLIEEFIKHHTDNPDSSISYKLGRIIKSYLLETTEKTWRYYFIKEPAILKYCNAKLFCYDGEELNKITLLQGKKATENSYVKLNAFLDSLN